MTIRINFQIRSTRDADGARGVSTTQRSGRSMAAAVAQEVAFRSGEDAYAEIVERIQTSFAADARAELVHIAYLFRRQIIGTQRSGDGRARGTLTFKLPASDTDVGADDGAFGLEDMLPAWAPRSPRYMAEKRRRGWSDAWFKARGDLANEMRGPNLEKAYGGVRVSVIRNLPATAAAAATGRGAGGVLGRVLNVGDAGAGHVRLNVATIRVFAMPKITPAMLPALRDGNLTNNVDDDIGRGRRFLAPLRESGQLALYHRLSRASYQGKYRPTLEPYLAWYLTRAIPNAVARRLEEGGLRPAGKSTAGRVGAARPR